MWLAYLKFPLKWTFYSTYKFEILHKYVDLTWQHGVWAKKQFPPTIELMKEWNWWTKENFWMFNGGATSNQLVGKRSSFQWLNHFGWVHLQVLIPGSHSRFSFQILLPGSPSRFSFQVLIPGHSQFLFDLDLHAPPVQSGPHSKLFKLNGAASSPI